MSGKYFIWVGEKKFDWGRCVGENVYWDRCVRAVLKNFEGVGVSVSLGEVGFGGYVRMPFIASKCSSLNNYSYHFPSLMLLTTSCSW